MKFKKIPHPWWHYFFTKYLDSSGYLYSLTDKAWELYRCSKCKKDYYCTEEDEQLEVSKYEKEIL